MPFTPYHFGPSGFIGLVFRKWIDVPVFVLANVAVDIEVLLYSQWPMHRHAHTLLIGAAVGALWGIVAYPLRPLFKKIMQILRVPYETNFWKMLISGLLGVWFHVVIDAFYNWDVRLFWPNDARPLFNLMNEGQVKLVCLAFFVVAFVVYAFIALSYTRRSKAKKAGND